MRVNEVCGAGVVGLGFGNHHIRSYIANGVKVAGVCDISKDRLSRAQAEHGVEFATTDYRRLLARDDISMVSVVVPEDLHADVAVAAMRSGKDVFCEKPLACSVEDALKIVRAADETGQTCMVGHVCRLVPAFTRAKELIDAGEIGDIFFMESDYIHNYDAHVQGLDGWRLRMPKGFVVLSGACHAVDIMRWIARDEVAEASAYSNHKVLPHWRDDDCYAAILRFAGGAIGKTFLGAGVRRPYTIRAVFYGARGTIACDNTSREILLTRTVEKDGEWKRIPVEIDNHNVAAEIAQFLAVLRGEKELELDAREGARTVAACCAIVESAQRGKPVSPQEVG